MKQNTCFALVLLAAPLAWGGAEAYARTWSDATGKYTIEADLVDCRDGVVRLKKPDGQIISFPLSKLSAADRALIQGQSAAPEASAGQDAAAAEGGSDAVLIELLTGAKSQGQLVARDAESISIRVNIAGRSLLRKYPLERLHAITIGGQREVLQEKPSAEATSRPRAGTSSSEGTAATGETRRTRAEVESMIDKLGRTPPDWFDSEPLDYPQTLDLSWPEKPPGDWNSQRNMGQYIWDVINPNPGKWRSGVRLMHHLLTVHKDNPQLQLRIMDSLGRMYQFLLEDYARAAFWWRKSGADRDSQSPRGINLAVCYWKLGNKQMAVDLLNRLPIYYSAIKLWADMGETRRALQYAEAGAQGDTADIAYLCAGDACRVAGQHQQALDYYQKVLGVRADGQCRQTRRAEPAAGPGQYRGHQALRHARPEAGARRLLPGAEPRLRGTAAHRGRRPQRTHRIGPGHAAPGETVLLGHRRSAEKDHRETRAQGHRRHQQRNDHLRSHHQRHGQGTVGRNEVGGKDEG